LFRIERLWRLGILADEIPVAFLVVELESEAGHVAFRIGRAALAGPSRSG